MNFRNPLLFGGVLLSLVFMGAGCYSSPPVQPPATISNSQPAAPTPSQPTTQKTDDRVSVSIANFAFSPATITVKAGITVTWTNRDAMAHTITVNDGSFDSGSIANNGTYSHTFTKAGTYAYHCAFHPTMQAVVIVQ